MIVSPQKKIILDFSTCPSVSTVQLIFPIELSTIHVPIFVPKEK
jgi:hypothetical protein